MNVIAYLKYFTYLASNWNLQIAWTIVMQEIKGEKKYGINTTGADDLQELDKKGIDISHATIYMPVSYSFLEEIFSALEKIKENQTNPPKIEDGNGLNHFVDIGCGKGRALCLAAHAGFKYLTGLDFSKTLCDAAVVNLKETANKITGFSFNVINNDAYYFDIPDDADCIFLFNPFDEFIMKAVVHNIAESLVRNKRTLYIIYVNPLHLEVFTNVGFSVLWHEKKMKYLEAVILKK